MQGFAIDGKKVGQGAHAFVIAEIGSNFDGSMEKAKRLIDAAASAGADAVKFQTFSAEKIITAKAEKPAYQKNRESDSETYQQSLKKFEISKEGHFMLKEHCRKAGVIFLSTPHSGKESLAILEELGVGAFKIGSGDITNIQFLGFAASKKKPVLLSTGMATLPEISAAVSAVRKTGNNKILLFQCTSEYPCPVENVNLLAMKTLQKKFRVPVGLSDHTTSVAVPVAAVALGASAIEKHFTLNRNDKGPDHRASVEPEEFARIVSYIREAEKALGSAEKKPNDSELKLAETARKSIVAAADINAGETVSAEKLEIKRPGTGIKPSDIAKVIGKKAKLRIEKDSIISFDDLV